MKKLTGFSFSQDQSRWVYHIDLIPMFTCLYCAELVPSRVMLHGNTMSTCLIDIAGYMQLLSQLTGIGEVSEMQFYGNFELNYTRAI